ncbi:MAG: cytochrome c maturation protein CcmE [Alphaproteobacteria bacterium]|nr:cytochrome c maturation protein CcmE [Alphaproteobacteria bacterium]
MTRKERRLLVLGASMTALGLATALVLLAFRDNLVFFYSPTELVEMQVPEGRRVRIGGLVEERSVERRGDTVVFRVTDTATTTPVTYIGILPDLFREGQGVVIEGALQQDGTFRAASVLAKHDESYMPREVADALKKQGYWQPGERK